MIICPSINSNNNLVSSSNSHIECHSHVTSSKIYHYTKKVTTRIFHKNTCNTNKTIEKVSRTCTNSHKDYSIMYTPQPIQLLDQRHSWEIVRKIVHKHA